jgi:hypothetical protein
MSLPKLHLFESVSAPSAGTAPRSSTPDWTTIKATGTLPADRCNALDLLLAWGHLPGPDFSDPESIHDPHRPLGFRRGPVYQGTRAAKRAAADCPLRLPGRGHDATPRVSAGPLTHWSANSPPALLSA